MGFEQLLYDIQFVRKPGTGQRRQELFQLFAIGLGHPRGSRDGNQGIEIMKAENTGQLDLDAGGTHRISGLQYIRDGGRCRQDIEQRGKCLANLIHQAHARAQLIGQASQLLVQLAGPAQYLLLARQNELQNRLPGFVAQLRLCGSHHGRGRDTAGAQIQPGVQALLVKLIGGSQKVHFDPALQLFFV